jgi:uncharacterized Fe-S cluster-containing radical SAM superfamily enzyme
MSQFFMYLCDTCGYAHSRAGVCPFCEVALTQYSKDDRAEYQVNMEEAIAKMSDYRWYI